MHVEVCLVAFHMWAMACWIAQALEGARCWAPLFPLSSQGVAERHSAEVIWCHMSALFCASCSSHVGKSLLDEEHCNCGSVGLAKHAIM